MGPVGSGKSSLVAALLGEMPLSAGSVAMTGQVSLCTQQPWVLNRTCRDNVRFDTTLPFDEELYGQVWGNFFVF